MNYNVQSKLQLSVVIAVLLVITLTLPNTSNAADYEAGWFSSSSGGLSEKIAKDAQKNFDDEANKPRSQEEKDAYESLRLQSLLSSRLMAMGVAPDVTYAYFSFIHKGQKAKGLNLLDVNFMQDMANASTEREKEQTARILKMTIDQFVTFTPDASMVEGTDYLLTGNSAAEKSREVEVVVLFHYGCSHCRDLEPLLTYWTKLQKTDVDVRLLPAVWNKGTMALSAIYFAAEDLGVLKASHSDIFEQVKYSPGLYTGLHKPTLMDFFSKFGVGDKVMPLIYSSEVQAKIDKAVAERKTYNIDGVPEVIINGKYRVPLKLHDNKFKFLMVLNKLIQQER